MAQSGFTPISIYYSATATNVPTAGNLVAGELAINTADGKLFYKDSAGVVQTIASKAGALGDVVGPASATDNALARFDATTGKLIQNSVGILSDAGALSGLTGLSTTSVTDSGLTSGRVTYAGTAGLLQDSANMTFNGTNLYLAAPLGVRTSSPNFPVDVVADANAVAVSIRGRSSDNLSLYQFTDNSTGNTQYSYILGGPSELRLVQNGANYINLWTNSAERMRITSAGQLLVGATSSTAGAGSGYMAGFKGTTSQSYISVARSGTNLDTDGMILGVDTSSGNVVVRENLPLLFHTNNTERMRIAAAGNLSIGTTNAGARLTIAFSSNSGPCIISDDTTPQNGNTFHQFRNNGTTCGTITSNGTTVTSYNITSDQRLKENIIDSPSASEDIDAIKVRSFDWITDKSNVKYGFIAQELIEVAPYAVFTPKNTEEMMQVDYSKLVPMMIKEIQDLKQRIKTLENK